MTEALVSGVCLGFLNQHHLCPSSLYRASVVAKTLCYAGTEHLRFAGDIFLSQFDVTESIPSLNLPCLPKKWIKMQPSCTICFQLGRIYVKGSFVTPS